MTKKTIIGLSLTALLFILGVTVFNTYRSYYDRDIKLQSAFKRQKGAIAVNYDNMWKILKQKAQITDKSVDAFKSIYIPMIEGRYSKGDGSLMKWVTEQNPEFKQSQYTDLSQSVEALRKEFEIEQRKMLAIVEQHDNLRNEFWSSIFLSHVKPLVYKPITSTQTEDVMKSGKDDDIQLFDKK